MAPRDHRPVLLLLAAFSRHASALDWVREMASVRWGEIALESPRFTFNETQFYERTMGTDLKKTFFVFKSLFDPAQLACAKRQAIQWEAEYTSLGRHEERRPLNLDPGYLSEAKLVLASTKDRDHRLYLRDGIFAEVTLYYYHGGWQTRDWTYPDYRRSDYHVFFTTCRDYLRGCYRQGVTEPVHRENTA